MKEIDHYIRKEARDYKRKATQHQNKLKDNAILLQKITNEYNEWLNGLNQMMSNGLYRQTLKEIEENKNNYEFLKKEWWKYRIIKAKAIIKIIKIKINKHSEEIILENSSQNLSLKFWFNQLFLTLEELNLEFRYDINEHIDYNSNKIIEPVQTIIEYYLEFIYYLCIFSFRTNSVIPLISYLSIAEKFIPFIPFFSKSKSLKLLGNIILFKIKILIENCDFLPAIENIKIVFKLCFREIYFFLDFDSEINLDNFNKKGNIIDKKTIGFCGIIQKIIMAYFLYGVLCEHLGFFKNAISEYKQCRWFSNTFFTHYNKEIFKFFINLEKKYIIYKEIFDDIRNQLIFHNKIEQTEKKRQILSNKKFILSYRNNHNATYNTIYHNKSKQKNSIRLKSITIKSPKKREKLENLLENIGYNLYKEEENRNNNIFKKFSKNTFVLSTVKMIDNLLSDKYSNVLKKMDKVELTKQQENINHLINLSLKIKKEKSLKNKLMINMNRNKKNISQNKSCFEFNYLNNDKLIQSPIKKNIKLIKNFVTSKNSEIKNKNDYNQRKMKKCQSTKNNLYPYNNFIKYNSFLSISKDKQNKSTRNTYWNEKKILKYPLNKDVFSISLKTKKNYLDSFYEKELKFQKKLLKLKAYDMEKVSSDYNQQKVINSAEQDFKIISCFAESKNTKKNLINLIKNTGDVKNLEMMFQNKKPRDRSNQKINLINLKNFMLLNHINPADDKYEPNDAIKNNEEKSKILNMECAKIEELQNQNETKRKNLMNKRIKIRKNNEKKYF